MNAKHQFKYTYDGGCEDFSPLEVTFEIPGDASLSQMLYNFEAYLRASGFFFNGTLQIVDETLDDIDTSDEVYGCMADFDRECGCDSITSPCETSTWDEQFDVTKTTVSSKDSISTDNYQKRRNWDQAQERLKEWNEGIAKLDNEQRKKDYEQNRKMSDLHYEATKEVVKNKWFHGLCNPPSPDWKNKNE